jgi:putative ABC transport system permease protein
VMGTAIDLLSGQRSEIERFNIEEALKQGRLPQKTGEILISDELAKKLSIDPDDAVTLISSTMYGSMAMQNFIVTGTVIFGVTAMDRGAIIVDIADAQAALDMDNTAGELLGYFNNNRYDDAKAMTIKTRFESRFGDSLDEFAPTMQRLKEQNNLAGMLDMMGRMGGIMITMFIVAMSIVLWNTGLIGGLRRYGEVGVRLALGEDKGSVYRSMIIESFFIGLFGSIIGVLLGLGASYYFQEKGLNFGAMMDATMMLPTVFRAQITTEAYYIGFIPGVFSTILGTVLAGIGIYRRNTAQLFKELEA